MTDDQMKALREAVEDGHLRVSVSVGVGSPVATIGTRELLELVHAGQRVLSSPRVETRRKALEEAAKVAEAFSERLVSVQSTKYPDVKIGSHLELCASIAAAIRSLSPQGE